VKKAVGPSPAKMDEVLKAKRLTQEILARAASIKSHMAQVTVSMERMELMERSSNQQVDTPHCTNHMGCASAVGVTCHPQQCRPHAIVWCTVGCRQLAKGTVSGWAAYSGQGCALTEECSCCCATHPAATAIQPAPWPASELSREQHSTSLHPLASFCMSCQSQRHTHGALHVPPGSGPHSSCDQAAGPA
jgi:hypothetical protein